MLVDGECSVMEDLRFQLERTQSELMIACARLRGTEVLARNVEDLRTENDILREQLHRYEDELLSVENRLESFASLHGTDGVPLMEVQRPVAVTSLLEENQKLHNIIEMMQRQRLPGQDGQLMVRTFPVQYTGYVTFGFPVFLSVVLFALVSGV